jgi:dephospho-CoA kinase
VLLVGLTGGIGAGKSTVAQMLAQRGAVVVDADDLARRAVGPGTPGFDAVVAAFGPDLVATNGHLDRTKLASLVFADEQARRRLESIVHPEVARLFAKEAARYRDTDTILVYVVPLLAENYLQDMFDIVVVVTAARAARVTRLATARDMNAEAISGRMDAQLSDEERERVAHVVIPNDGSVEELQGKVDDLWARLQSSTQEGAGR